MRTRWLMLVLLMTAVLVSSREQASGQAQIIGAAAMKYGPSVLKFLGAHFCSKLLDGVYDPNSERKNINLLRERLEQLEVNAALRSDLQDAVRTFRLELSEYATREEMERKIAALHDKLVDLYLRVEELEIDRELHQAQIADLKNRTSKSENANYFVLRGNAFATQGDNIHAYASYGAAFV